MKVNSARDGNVDISLSKEELIIISNALNEICHGIYIEEFETRIGFSLADVKRLHDHFQNMF